MLLRKKHLFLFLPNQKGRGPKFASPFLWRPLILCISCLVRLFLIVAEEDRREGRRPHGARPALYKRALRGPRRTPCSRGFYQWISTRCAACSCRGRRTETKARGRSDGSPPSSEQRPPPPPPPPPPLLSQRHTVGNKICHFISDTMDYFLADEDQQQSNQPNDQAGG